VGFRGLARTMSLPIDSQPEHGRAKAVIVGGGMAGFTLGLALASAGLAVVIIDREDPAQVTAAAYDGRASAIAHASANVFKAIGLWETLAPSASPIADIRVADGHPLRGVSPLFLHYDHREIGDEPFGYILENRALREALHSHGQAMDALTVVRPASVIAIERDHYGAAVLLDDGRRFKGEIIIAADGRHSSIRQQAGISHSVFKYNQTSIVCTVAHERDHQGVAVELFLPSGPFAMLPMTNKRCNVVWTERSDLAQHYLALKEASFLDELRQRFGEWLGEIELTGPRFSFPLSVLHADRYSDLRLALLGDAAHAIHPIAGQGLNLGLRDVAALAELIVDASRLGLDVGSAPVLERYARWRRFDNMLLTAVTDGLNRLFSNDIGPVRHARDLGLSLVNSAPLVKKLFMRHAMGHVGDLPRLIRGQTL
jgi:2-octaprenyl-6-methoxyphenol hydroxylase